MVKNIVGIFDSKLQAKCEKIDYAAAYITTIYASSRYIFPTICQQKSGKMLSYTCFIPNLNNFLKPVQTTLNKFVSWNFFLISYYF